MASKSTPLPEPVDGTVGMFLKSGSIVRIEAHEAIRVGRNIVSYNLTVSRIDTGKRMLIPFSAFAGENDPRLDDDARTRVRAARAVPEQAAAIG